MNKQSKLPYPEQIVLHRNLRTLRHVRNFMQEMENEGQMISFDDALRICQIACIYECHLQFKDDVMNLVELLNKNNGDKDK